MENYSPDFTIELEDDNSDEINKQDENKLEIKKVNKENVNKLEIKNEIQYNKDSLTKIAETIVVYDAPLPAVIKNKLEPQQNKYWHFKFKNEMDEYRLKKQIEQVNNVTVEFDYKVQKNADVTIMKNNEIIGKIHFLYFDRRDLCNESKWYLKLHFYNFNKGMFLKIKDIMLRFFKALNTNIRGGKKRKETKKFNKQLLRKKTIKNIKNKKN